METKKDWTPNQIIKFKEFHYIAKRRLALGESDESAFRDKPEGYTEWAMLEFKDHGGVRLPKMEDIPQTVCWNCGKSYIGNRCTYCHSFKPRV
jgi:hypothetical protein